MAEITAALVKELRERSGVGMMDCKKALQETDGDITAAIDWLRAKGLSKAAKKADRVAAEGLVAVATREDGKGEIGAAIEFNAETDFVARNDLFQDAAKSFAQLGLEHHTVEAIHGATLENGSTVQDEVTRLIATIGENMQLRRTAVMSVDQGVVASYIHSATAPGLGKIGVLVALESAGDKAKLAELGKQLAMHVAATKPESVSTADLDPALIDRERSVLSEQARESGKAEEIIGKMVEGRLRKFYEEVVLSEQVFVIDGENRVSKVVEMAAKDVGAPIRIAAFCRFALGEGIEKKETDFAAEVAAAAGLG